MKNLILGLSLMFILSITSIGCKNDSKLEPIKKENNTSTLLSEKEINNLARKMSDNLSGTKIMNSEITINRVYSVKRDIITVYNIPEDMELSTESVRKERIEQLKDYGGDVFYENEINLVLFFMKDKKRYKNTRVDYFELKK